MKWVFVLTLCLFVSPTLWAQDGGDDIIMATSEDLSEFDKVLARQPMPKEVRQAPKPDQQKPPTNQEGSLRESFEGPSLGGGGGDGVKPPPHQPPQPRGADRHQGRRKKKKPPPPPGP